MKSLPLGFFVLALVFAYTLMGMDMSSLLNAHAIVIVFVGTIGVFALSTPLSEIFYVFHCVKSMKKPDYKKELITKDLIDLSKKKSASTQSSHPLIQYAKELWEQGLDPELFETLLDSKNQEMNGNTEKAVASLKNLAKYPPALGMTGTVIGLVELFSKLTPDNQSNLGPSLALALTATFYGLFISNLLIMPLADRLNVIHLKDSKQNENIFNVLILINQGEPTSVIKGELEYAA